MSQRPEQSPAADHAYREIERALASTEIGRNFLEEHARRSREHDLRSLMDATAKLGAWTPGTPVAEARSDNAETAVGRPATAAARAALEATERLQDAAWAMRETGQDDQLCDLIEAETGTIADALTRLVTDPPAEPPPMARPDPFWEELRQDALARLDAVRALAEERLQSFET